MFTFTIRGVPFIPVLAILALFMASLVCGTAMDKMVPIAGGWNPNEEILYYNESSYPISAERAARSWDGVDSAKIKRTFNKSLANVIIKDMSHADSMKQCAQACLGQVSRIGKFYGGKTDLYILNSTYQDPSIAKTQTLAHEFGHILGLKHSKSKCALMSTLSSCPMFLAKKKDEILYTCGPMPMDAARFEATIDPWCQMDEEDGIDYGGRPN